MSDEELDGILKKYFMRLVRYRPGLPTDNQIHQLAQIAQHQRLFLHTATEWRVAAPMTEGRLLESMDAEAVRELSSEIAKNHLTVACCEHHSHQSKCLHGDEEYLLLYRMCEVVLQQDAILKKAMKDMYA